MTTWISSYQPSFFNELLDLPKKISKRVSKKIALLEQDPYSAKGDAKKLKDFSNVYRVRIGDYRLFYVIGDSWLKILSIRKRDEQTYSIENPKVVEDINKPTSQLEPIPAKGPDYKFPATEALPVIPEVSEKPLPRTFTKVLLKQWQIPQDYWEQILPITTEERLLNLELPEHYLNRILDNLFPKSLAEIEAQPSYLLQDVTDLDKFIEGEITDFLLKLDPEQEKFRDFGKGGAVLVKGGPGTGKSTLALYRTQKLIKDGYQSILFTTYTNALVTFSQQLLAQLLKSPPQDQGVAVNTVDSLAYRYYVKTYGRPNFASPAQAKKILQQALDRAIQTQTIPAANVLYRKAREKKLEKLGINYLFEEIQNVLLNQGIETPHEYFEANRRGRGIGLTDDLRASIWVVYEHWCELLAQQKLTTWEQLRCKVLVIAEKITKENKPYQALIIDEAQDLSPVSLRFLLALVPDFSGVYLTADASQSLYQKGFSWKQIHSDLKVQGRTLLLKKNYRNTQQIAIACQQILQDTEAGDKECLEQIPSPYQGNIPAIAQFPNLNEEINHIKQFLSQSAKKHRLPIWSSAVLCPTNDIAATYAKKLEELGLKAKFVKAKDIDIKAQHIKVLTLHSAKGLEFPFVILGLSQSRFPEMLAYELAPEDQQIYLDSQRRLFYVGCSRAMRELLVTLPEPSQDFYQTLTPPHWQSI